MMEIKLLTSAPGRTNHSNPTGKCEESKAQESLVLRVSSKAYWKYLLEHSLEEPGRCCLLVGM